MDQLRFDTTAFPLEERFERWRAGITDFELEEVDNSAPFDGRSTVTGLGALLISQSELPPLRFVRTRAMVRADRHDHWTLSFGLEGTMRGDADGRPFVVEPGGLLLLSHERPAEVITTRGRTMVIVLPHNLLGAGTSKHAHGPLPDSAESRLLAGYLRHLSDALPGLDPASALPVSRALCELVEACLPTAEQQLPARARGRNLRRRLLAYVDAHLDADLDVEALCSAFAVSRSALYRAVKCDGGVQGLVRTVRLEAAHRALADREEERSIQEIARASGFTDSPQFSRQFHAAFGYTAAELRRRSAVSSALPRETGDAAASFRDATYRLITGPNAG